MVTDASAPTSEDLHDAKPIEGEAPSGETPETESQDISPQEMLASLTGETIPAKSDPEMDGDANDPPEGEGKSSEEGEGEDGKEGEEENLESLLNEKGDQGEPNITFKKKSSVPELKDGDVEETEDGKLIINSKPLLNDFTRIFGLSGETADLSVFLKKNNQANSAKKRQYLDKIAEMAGFDSRHAFAASIERFTRAKSGDGKMEVLESEFPEWAWNSDAEVPIRAGEKKPSENEPDKTVESKIGLPWSDKDLDRAINDYVADNENVRKQDVLKSAKLVELLRDFSGLSKKGKPLSADEVLKMAIPMSNLQKQPISKDAKVSIGGTRIKSPKNNSNPIKPEMNEMLGAFGLDAKKFSKYESSKKN